MRGNKRDEMATSMSFFKKLSQTGNFRLHFVSGRFQRLDSTGPADTRPHDRTSIEKYDCRSREFDIVH